MFSFLHVLYTFKFAGVDKASGILRGETTPGTSARRAGGGWGIAY
jgi:hypothetical protein